MALFQSTVTTLLSSGTEVLQLVFFSGYRTTNSMHQKSRYFTIYSQPGSHSHKFFQMGRACANYTEFSSITFMNKIQFASISGSIECPVSFISLHLNLNIRKYQINNLNISKYEKNRLQMQFSKLKGFEEEIMCIKQRFLINTHNC